MLSLVLVLAAVSGIASAQSDVVSVYVDATQRGEPLKHVWQYYGYDECNYTTTPDCVDLMKTVAQINAQPTYLREHFLLNSGDGTATLKWGSTNAYTEDKDGRPVYSWQIMDPIMDAVVASGCRPLVEIGFMPRDLSSRPEPYRNSDTYKLDGGCFYPPKDYEKWAELIRQWVRHSAARYKNVEENWLWELWNEPDIAYWHGTHEEYCKLFDHTEKALHEVLPRATLGGPHTAGSGRFLRDFLRALCERNESCLGTTGHTARLHRIPRQGRRLAPGRPRANGPGQSVAAAQSRVRGRGRFPAVSQHADHHRRGGPGRLRRLPFEPSSPSEPIGTCPPTRRMRPP